MRTVQTAGLVAVAVGGFLAVTSLLGPSDAVDAHHPGTEEPVVRSRVVCPFVDGEADHEGVVGVLALPNVETAPDQDAEPQPISVTELRLPEAPHPEEDEPDEDEPDEDATPDPEETQAAPEEEPEPEPVLTVVDRGVPTLTEVDTDEGTSFTVEGRGSLAAGLVAEQSGLLQRSDLRGLATAPCTAPEREHWFVGASGEVGRRGRLVLANPTDVAAVVDLTLWDESGPIDAPATRDIGVPARSQQVILLDALAPESVSVGVHVRASQGRVSAAVEVRESDGDSGAGMSFLPAAVAPSERVVVPGVPSHGERTLRILAPGDTDAIVSLQALGADGAFTPAGLEVTTVRAGTAVDVPLDALGDTSGGLVLDSDQPITAAVRVVDRPSDDESDVAFTAAAKPLVSKSAALLGQTTDDLTSTLHLTSTVDTATRATVRTLAADGSAADEAVVDIPPLATVSMTLEAPKDMDVAAIVVEPSAPDAILATREMTGSDDDGALLDLMTLVSPPVTVHVPDVVGELPEVPAPDDDGAED